MVQMKKKKKIQTEQIKMRSLLFVWHSDNTGKIWHTWGL